MQSLESESGDLFTRPLDEITAENRDEVLKRYSSIVHEATRGALKHVLADLQRSSANLHTELSGLMAH